MKSQVKGANKEAQVLPRKVLHMLLLIEANKELQPSQGQDAQADEDGS